MASRRTQTADHLPLLSTQSQFTLSSSASFRSLVHASAVKEKMLPRYLRDKATLSATTHLQSLPFSRDEAAFGRYSEGRRLSHDPSAPDGQLSGARDDTDAKKRKFESLLAVVNEDQQNVGEVVFRYEKGELTRGELQELLDHGDTSQEVLQAYFYALKRKNTKKALYDLHFNRVKLYKPGTALCIFTLNKAEQTHVQTDPFSYE